MPADSALVPETATAEERVAAAFKWLRSGYISSLVPILPLLLNLKGKPYTLKNHFPFEPFFSTHLPRRSVWQCGRQCSKSTNLASQGVVQANCIPYFNILYVTPLFEMIRRFSTNYVRGFIDQSPVRRLFLDETSSANVLQRSFRNNSKMFFSYAFLDADRVRGIDAAAMKIDEAQDLDRSFIPVIRETMSASDWGLEQFTGTPKTLDGTLASLFNQSSQAEWLIRCQACNYWNVPSLDHDLDAMTGPNIVTREISEETPGVVCAKCSRPVFPRTGRWVHRREELRHDFAGYHVPQLIMPMHYASPEKWAILLGKRQGFGNTTTAVYYNECCGESYDSGAKLVTLTELKAAATLPANKLDNAVRALKTNKYKHRILSIDWGGGGDDEVSFTTAAVLGLKPDGKIDVLFGWRSLTPHDHFGEARRLLHIMSQCRITHAVHDYSGAGATRETILVSAGVPAQHLVPISYIRAGSGPLMRLIDANEATGQRLHYRVDKARSLVLTCNLIKRGWVNFFAYDYIGPGQEGLLHDFLALTESKVDTRLGTDIYTVIRSALGGPDDFAQAVNIGICALYYQEQKWPDMAEIDRLSLTPEQLSAIAPKQGLAW